MKAYTYSDARKRFSEVLDTAKREEVIIKRRGGEVFSLVYKNEIKSPFDVPGITTDMTTNDILTVIKDSRSQY